MSKPKRHHQVPQFYLRGFADRGNHVKVVRFGEAPAAYTTNVKNVAVEANFYRVDWLDAERESLAEKLIGEIEQAAVAPLQALAQHEQLSVEQRYHVASWVVLQYLRGRGTRVDSVGLQKIMLRADLALGGKQRLASRLKLTDADAIEAAWDRIVVRGDLSDPPTARRNHLKTMFDGVTHMAAHYARAQWQVVTFGRHRLFTSDQPVYLWRDRDDDSGVGMLTADRVSLPLNRTTGLAIYPKMQTGSTEFSQPSTLLYRSFAINAWAAAEEIVIMHPGDELPDWLPATRPAHLGNLDLPDIQRFIDMGEQFRRRHQGGAKRDNGG
ncbi:DUF4238 domain-containing protein [Dactylosporangium sp. NPDC049525]|uniref:DUF4238 domain-containing protein n=1 Tax=Dactylosporangium sp. NPDC049525 TaxID=3154730 RepID=UPI003416F307